MVSYGIDSGVTEDLGGEVAMRKANDCEMDVE